MQPPCGEELRPVITRGSSPSTNSSMATQAIGRQFLADRSTDLGAKRLHNVANGWLTRAFFVGDTGFEPVTSSVSGQKALVGNAGDCCVSSVSTVAYVCHCAGWLADSLADRLWFRHKPSCREKAWAVPRGGLCPRTSRHERAAVMLIPFRRWAPRSASRLARGFPRCSRAPRSARPIPQVRLGLLASPVSAYTSATPARR
jgi:hypothetical protein